MLIKLMIKRLKYVAFSMALMVAVMQNVMAIDIEKNTKLSIEDCIEIAIDNNPSITLGNNVADVYKSRSRQVKSAYFPQVNLSSGYNRQNPATSINVDRSTNQYSGNVGVDQLLFDFGRTHSKAKIQDLNYASSKYDTENTVIQVVYNVKQAYYSALSAKINKSIYSKSIKSNEQHLKQAKAFFEAGLKSKIDVTTAEVNLSNAKLNYIKADNLYKTTIASLNNAMGIPDAPIYEVVDTLTFKNIANEVSVAAKDNKTQGSSKNGKPAVLNAGVTKFDFIDNLTLKKFDITFDDAIKNAYANRPDLKALVEKESSAKESVKLAKKEYLPSLSGSANYGFGGQEFPLDNGWSFGANATIPVFNGFLTKNQIDEAKTSVRVVKSNIDVLKQAIYLQVQQSYINLTESEKRIPVANMIVKQAKENLELANGRYNVGVGNSVEVQDAETNYNNAQLSYIQALYDYNLAKSSLEKAMGAK